MKVDESNFEHSFSPVSMQDIMSFETKYNFSLPDDYKQFLLINNGGKTVPEEDLQQMIIQKKVNWNSMPWSRGYANELFASVGLFLSVEKAWLAIDEFCKTGERTDKIDWIEDSEMPEESSY